MSVAFESTPVIETILRRVTTAPELSRLAAELRHGSQVVSIAGLTSGPARALAIAALQRESRRRFAIIVPSNRDIESWERDLSFWYAALNPETGAKEEEGIEPNGGSQKGLPLKTGNYASTTVLSMPASENDPYAGASPHPETLERNAVALWNLARGRGDFVLLAAKTLARRMVPAEQVLNAGAQLTREEDYPQELLVDQLAAGGYQREDPVKAMGEFSMRGGILDVWSAGCRSPVRIEFFGDTVESIREFDPESQLSVSQLNQVEIVPMRERTATAAEMRAWARAARERWHEERFDRALRDRLVYAEEGEVFPGWEWLLPLSQAASATVFDYLRDAVLVIDEPVAVETQLKNDLDLLAFRFSQTDEADEIGLAETELYQDAEELRRNLASYQRVEFRSLGRMAAAVDESFLGATDTPDARLVPMASQHPDSSPLYLFPAVQQAPEIDWPSHPPRRYHGRIPELAADVRRNIEQRHATVLFVMPATGVAERMAELLRDYGVSARFTDLNQSATAEELSAIVCVGRVTAGFELPGQGLITHVEADIFDEAASADFGQYRASGTSSGARSRKSKTAAFLSDFRDLKPGDYVVHIDHGIARFGGLQMLTLGERRGEFMLLYYADEAKLYVPVERLDLVQRYASAEAREPQLDKLGGIGWQKTKAKAKRAMREMADELLRLYAERKLVGGYAYAADSPWQREFEESFEYVPTPDQETAILEVKRSMEEPTPMDRLLCGDVGFGKTEVAMRAAFKAVMENKQVAVLTPTTVLAYQHYETFRARFAAFPVKIELLSRFRTPREQKEVVRRVASGEVDILIGTHRILSRDLSFRDLGLVVVDEEQRFGVAHKESLKQLKKRVDVLTLTATPIPRTLNMSLMGLRDMSVIETPPRDRLAINTQVVQFSESVVKSAIELELGRGGQAFFIHNRVDSIDTVGALVKRLVSQARVVVAHGQMNEKEMEGVMLDFVAYKHDVLVATTIIENGIDIPRANTIIINRADHYGLAQLYQLRGRVGRSNRRAYAYLLIPSEQELTPIARRRLAAIREFSELGAGFRIAALDLELRGAGNLLGGQQSGHMDALGFDLYTQMLEHTVAELRGEEVEDEPSVSLNLGVDVAVPEQYIFDMGQRLRTYKRIASARDEETLTQIRAETEDRYGRLPEQVEDLFGYARLRRAAEALGVVSIDRTPAGLAIKLREKARVATEKLLQLVRERPGTTFTPSGVLRLELTTEEENAIQAAYGVLNEIRVDG